MMIRIVRLSIVALLAVSPCLAEVTIGELVQVRPSGEIVPSNAVATITGVAAAVAAAEGASTAAAVAEATGVTVSNMLVDVQSIINGLEGVGYIRGYLLDFGTGSISENTNVTATIVAFTPAVSNDATYTYSDIYTYFNESPAEFPVCRWVSSIGRTNAWETATSVSVVLTNKLVGTTLYECYRNRVRVPKTYSASFFRVFAEAVQSQTGIFLPVRNGVSPNGQTPLTLRVTSGTNVISFVGGIRVQ
jgi:hypothetical protein